MRIIKNNLRLILGLVIGGLLAGVVVSALIGTDVTYSSSNTKLAASTVSGAVSEINDMVRGKFVSAYVYSTETATKCITGEESTCTKSTCYKGAYSRCNAGDIIKYRVNDSNIVTFHVLYNDRNTITMQSQKNIVYSKVWISELDYGSNIESTDKGPLTILASLEAATAGWVNVNDQTYEMGTTTFKTNAYTGCSSYNSCTTNLYTLPSRTAKARMITVQEAALVGCTRTQNSCPIWMSNYLKNSGETMTFNTADQGYLTMSVRESGYPWSVFGNRALGAYHVSTTYFGARAVVVVNK